ncbi:hypothetical protein IWQ60_002459 [Tieghemiomyces parasiticus]|uniref:Transcription regulator Rua1 C-terminal domain-containing protein n=1 Tax=Tieghemiomyces parasiticus TaxID=78921 RepID=A0A9W8E1M0_9FUNG|nr:hypothetical protein IWQ60_002459 [Tieghemiomyces parasiticus]
MPDHNVGYRLQPSAPPVVQPQNAHPTDPPLLDVEFWTRFGGALLELASRPGVCTEEFLAVAYQLQQAVMASQMRQEQGPSPSDSPEGRSVGTGDQYSQSAKALLVTPSTALHGKHRRRQGTVSPLKLEGPINLIDQFRKNIPEPSSPENPPAPGLGRHESNPFHVVPAEERYVTPAATIQAFERLKNVLLDPPCHPRSATTADAMYPSTPADPDPTTTSGLVPSDNTTAHETMERHTPKFPEDMYTPRWTRGVGMAKEALCPLCQVTTETLRWFRLKVSAYWYHLNFFHGVASSTCRPHRGPLSVRTMVMNSGTNRLGKKRKRRETLVGAGGSCDEDKENQDPLLRPQPEGPGLPSADGRPVTQGLCHNCLAWVDLDSTKDVEVNVPEIYWWKHAQKCHAKASRGAARVLN